MDSKKKFFSFFEIFSLFWVVLAIWVTFLACFGLFYQSIVYFGLFFEIVLLFVLLYTKKISLVWTPWRDNLVFVLIFAWGLALSLSATPNLFGGRDEGSLTGAGILLAQNHGLKIEGDKLVSEFSRIYRQGKALNFPGFFYPKEGQLRSQFLPAFPAYIAFWWQVGGQNGLKLINLFPLVTLVFAFYLTVKKFTGNRPLAFSGVLVLISNFPFFIFYRIALSELFFGALVWLAFNFLLRYLELEKEENGKNYADYFLIFIPLFLAPLVRIEALPIIFCLFVILLFFGSEKNIRKVSFQLPFAILLSVAFFTVITNTDFFIDSIKGFVNISKPVERDPLLPAQTWDQKMLSFVPDDWKRFYVMRVFINYNLFIPLTVGAIYLFWLIKTTLWPKLVEFIKPTSAKHQTGNELSESTEKLPNQSPNNQPRLRPVAQDYDRQATSKPANQPTSLPAYQLLPFFFFLPTLAYLVNSTISLDHPWMLRRFVFSIIPLFLLYAFLALDEFMSCDNLTDKCSVIRLFPKLKLKIKNLFDYFITRRTRVVFVYAIIGLCIGFNIALFAPFWQKSGNDNLLGQVAALAKNFGDNDLILVSQKASGSGWSLIAEPLRLVFGKQAVYFFNPNDLKRVNLNKFDKIYLVAGGSEMALFKDIAKVKVKDYKIENEILHSSKLPDETPGMESQTVYGGIYLIDKEKIK